MTSFPLFSLSGIPNILKLNLIFFCLTFPLPWPFVLLTWIFLELEILLFNWIFLFNFQKLLLLYSSLNFFFHISYCWVDAIYFLTSLNIGIILINLFLSVNLPPIGFFLLLKKIYVFHINCFPQMPVILYCLLIFKCGHKKYD